MGDERSWETEELARDRLKRAKATELSLRPHPRRPESNGGRDMNEIYGDAAEIAACRVIDWWMEEDRQIGDLTNHIAEAIRQAVAEEREACAEIAKNTAGQHYGSDALSYGDGWRHACRKIESAIRAKGNKP